MVPQKVLGTTKKCKNKNFNSIFISIQLSEIIGSLRVNMMTSSADGWLVLSDSTLYITSCPELFCKKGVVKFRKIHMKTPVPIFFLIKL